MKACKVYSLNPILARIAVGEGPDVPGSSYTSLTSARCEFNEASVVNLESDHLSVGLAASSLRPICP